MKLAARLALAVALLAGAPAQAQNWKPSREVTIVVPWPAGGSSDQVTRLTAQELEKHLGQKIVVVNQPGASGSLGTKRALEAPKDGYTWLAGAAQDLGVYGALGMLETGIADWHLFLSMANLPPDEGAGRTGAKAPANYFGIFVPRGVPTQVVATLDRVWGDYLMRADALKKFAASRGAHFQPMTGQDAQKAARPAVQANAWQLHAAGKTKVSPDTVGIPKPE
jgi:tripartite-type tricarboxylate transporter receptor subunit TctC